MARAVTTLTVLTVLAAAAFAAATGVAQDDEVTLGEIENGLDVALEDPDTGERVGTARISADTGRVAVEVDRDEVATPPGATLTAWLWAAQEAGDEAWLRLGPLTATDGALTGSGQVDPEGLPRFDRVVVTAGAAAGVTPDAPGTLVARGEIPSGTVQPPGGEAVEEPAVTEEPAGQQEPFAEREPGEDAPEEDEDAPEPALPAGGVTVGALVAVVLLGALLAALYAASRRS